MRDAGESAVAAVVAAVDQLTDFTRADLVRVDARAFRTGGTAPGAGTGPTRWWTASVAGPRDTPLGLIGPTPQEEAILVQVLRDDRGVALALLAVGVPRGAGDPTPQAWRRLDAYARLVRSVLAVAVEAESAARRCEEAEVARADAERAVATVSHELRTPLAALVARVEMLLDPVPGEPDTTASLQAVSRIAARMGRVVDDLLHLSRIRATVDGVVGPAAPASGAPVPVAESVLDAVEVAQVEARRGGVVVSLVVGDPEALVAAPRGELDRAVLNLVANAVKFSPPGGEVAVEQRADRDHVWVEVRDQGVGIAREDLPHVFRPFYRARYAGAQRVPGTGLGLAIVHETVVRHGGDVTAESEPGRGSVFVLRLPRVQAPPA